MSYICAYLYVNNRLPSYDLIPITYVSFKVSLNISHIEITVLPYCVGLWGGLDEGQNTPEAASILSQTKVTLWIKFYRFSIKHGFKFELILFY